jgi:hypothetical protein
VLSHDPNFPVGQRMIVPHPFIKIDLIAPHRPLRGQALSIQSGKGLDFNVKDNTEGFVSLTL